MFEVPVYCCVQAWLCYRVSAAGRGKAAPGLLSGERGLGVCIREYLTPSQEAIYRKADETRHRRSDVITDCWTFRGRTFVRTSQDEVHEFNESEQFCSKESKTSYCVVMWILSPLHMYSQYSRYYSPFFCFEGWLQSLLEYYLPIVFGYDSSHLGLSVLTLQFVYTTVIYQFLLRSLSSRVQSTAAAQFVMLILCVVMYRVKYK